MADVDGSSQSSAYSQPKSVGLVCGLAANNIQFVSGQRPVMPNGWEGNRRSGVALAMRHRIKWFIYLRAHSLRKGDEHPAYTVLGVWRTCKVCLQHVN